MLIRSASHVADALQQLVFYCVFFFFSSRRRHTRLQGDWSSDVCSSDLSHQYPLLHHTEFDFENLLQVLRTQSLEHYDLVYAVHKLGRKFATGGLDGGEIGRASCRERV